MTTPVISVVIAARDAGATIDACLAALAGQTFAAREVIVVDDGSTDDTAERAARAGALVLSADGRGASVARNVGIAAARGRYVAFTDADCIPPPQWLGRFVEVLDSSGATGVGSGQRNVFLQAGRDAAAFDAFFRLASVVSDYTRTGGEAVRPVAHNPSCNSAYQRQALVDIGGFSEGLWPGEDVDLDIRLRDAGARLLFVPDADVAHQRPGTLAWFRRMMFRYGAAERELVRRHGRRRRVEYVPAALAAVVAAHGLYLVPACRPWMLAADLGLVAVGGAALVLTTRPRHWPDVLTFAGVGLWSWLAGWYSRGRHPAPAASAPDA